MEEPISVSDESGDRKYFTLVPNYILDHSTATAQALYLQLKRLAGEKRIAYPGSRYLRDKLEISQPTLRKEMSCLVEKGWIKYEGKTIIETNGGPQPVSTYSIVDLWNLNTGYYQRGVKIETQGVKKRGEKICTKEEPLEEEPFSKKRVATPAQIAKDFFSKGETYSELIGLFGASLPSDIVSREFDKFILYWTEPNGTGTKQRWQQQPTFEVKRRLHTWLGKVKSFNSRPSRVVL